MKKLNHAILNFFLLWTFASVLSSCHQDFDFSYTTIPFEQRVDSLEFGENQVTDPTKNTVLKSAPTKNGIKTCYYIIAPAGEETALNISPKVYCFKDTAYLSFKTVGKGGNAIETDMVNKLKLEYTVHDKNLKYMVFSPAQIFDSIVQFHTKTH